MEQSYTLFEVGGRVRDELLGLQSKDIDYSVVLADTNMPALQGFYWFRDQIVIEGYTIFLETPDCFTIRAKFPKHHIHSGAADFVLARKEIGYVEGTRTPICELGTLEDDLIRRDFTLNAIAKASDGSLIDPFGGQEALKVGVLDTPTHPAITFLDDPLRVLRALRFSITKGFDIADRVWQEIHNPVIWLKMEKVVSQERIREELHQMFKADTVATLKLLGRVSSLNVKILDVLFKEGMWLFPTNKK